MSPLELESSQPCCLQGLVCFPGSNKALHQQFLLLLSLSMCSCGLAL